MKNSSKVLKGVSGVGATPLLRRKLGKKRPRGKPFPKGNQFGLAFRFQPGNRANPGGRPSIKLASAAARALLAAPIPGDAAKRTFAEGIAQQLGWAALQGDRASAAELADRAEGRPAVTLISDGAPPALDLLLAEFTRIATPSGPPENFIPMRRKEENDEEQESDDRASKQDDNEVASGD